MGILTRRGEVGSHSSICPCLSHIQTDVKGSSVQCRMYAVLKSNTNVYVPHYEPCDSFTYTLLLFKTWKAWSALFRAILFFCVPEQGEGASVLGLNETMFSF